MDDSDKSVQKSQRRKKLHAVEAFGGKCQICGYSRCLNALEFHHVDNKIESPSYVIMRWSWARAKKELDRCVLLCANCHREVHYKELDVGYSDKLKVVPFINKRCQRCDKQFDTKIESQVFCSPRCFHLATRRCDRPTKEDLKILMSESSWVDIGRKFGVSDNAVRKWAKSYGLL